MTKTIAIIQARMSSTRLPGKVMKPILGKPMLERMIERVKRAETIDQIVVATSTKPLDTPICRLADKLGISFFRGSETDVLDRYYQAARKFSADIIVRLTADCPLIDPNLVDAVITTLVTSSADYVANRSIKQLVPSGMDAEAFTFSTLKKTHHQTTSAYDREHVTPYIYTHPDIFQIKIPSLPIKPIRPNLHLSVDTPADLKLIRHIYSQLYRQQPNFSLRDIMQLINHVPTKINFR